MNDRPPLMHQVGNIKDLGQKNAGLSARKVHLQEYNAMSSSKVLYVITVCMQVKLS